MFQISKVNDLQAGIQVQQFVFVDSYEWIPSVKHCYSLTKLLAQLIRASHSSMCRAERLRLEPRSTHNFSSVPFKFYCMGLLSYSVY